MPLSSCPTFGGCVHPDPPHGRARLIRPAWRGLPPDGYRCRPVTGHSKPYPAARRLPNSRDLRRRSVRVTRRTHHGRSKLVLCYRAQTWWRSRRLGFTFQGLAYLFQTLLVLSIASAASWRTQTAYVSASYEPRSVLQAERPGTRLGAFPRCHRRPWHPRGRPTGNKLQPGPSKAQISPYARLVQGIVPVTNHCSRFGTMVPNRASRLSSAPRQFHCRALASTDQASGSPRHPGVPAVRRVAVNQQHHEQAARSLYDPCGLPADW